MALFLREFICGTMNHLSGLCQSRKKSRKMKLNKMKKHLLKFLFLVTMAIGLSMTAFGQKKPKKPKKPKNPPKIIVPKKPKKPPKNNKRGKKPQFYSKFVRIKINSDLV